MHSDKTRAQEADAGDEAVIRNIPQKMVDAWNRGSGDAFAAPFGESADFIAFEGTHLKGRRAIAAFHQRLFDTVVKGTRIEGEAKFVRFLEPELAVMQAVVRVALPGKADTSPSRDSMQLFVAAKRDGAWGVEAMLNARQLTLERQYFLDEYESLPSAAQQQVRELIASLRTA